MANYPWIAAQRESAFRAELNDKNVWIMIAAMMLSEGSPQQSLESLMNRVMYMRANGKQMSLLDMIKSGFYGPYDRGEYPQFIARIRGSQALVDQMDAAINAVMAGSDTIAGFTDQGLPTDPNGQHQPQIHIGGNVFNDWGGGPNSHAGAAAWRQKFETDKLSMPAPAPAPQPAPVPQPVPAPPPPPPPLPTPAPAPAPAPAPSSVELDQIIALLKAAGKLPKPVIHITTAGDVQIYLNGVLLN